VGLQRSLRYSGVAAWRTLKVDLVRDPLPHWKPVEGPQQRAGVDASSMLADNPGKVDLNALEFVESCLGCAAQNGVAVVKS